MLDLAVIGKGVLLCLVTIKMVLCYSNEELKQVAIALMFRTFSLTLKRDLLLDEHFRSAGIAYL